jgi:indole-3-glycerol phosphate synthase
MPVTLDEILRATRLELDAVRGRRATLEREAEASRTPPSLRLALRRDEVAVIAEIKRRSPSAGAIREDLDPAGRAELYARHGAAAVSVLTDSRYFGGSIDDLRAAARRASVPVLRKDFILDEVQILEARAAGAAAVLVIVRAVGARLRPLLVCAADLRLDALVEVHTLQELEAALEAGATIVGVNSRDLDTFTIDQEAAWHIVSQVPPDCIAVAESGMVDKTDVARASAAGADAVLIGTALSAATSPEGLLQQLARVPRHAR